MEKFQTTLNSGRIGHTGSNIVYEKNSRCFKLRPSGWDERALGVLVRGEDNVYQSVKNIFGLEKAVEAMQHMKFYN